MSLFSMEKDNTRGTFKIIQYKKLRRDRFLFALSGSDFILIMSLTYRYLSIRKKKHLKCRTWTESCRSSTRYDLIICQHVFCCLSRSHLDHRILEWCPIFFCFLYSSVDSWYYTSFLIPYGARLQDILNMRLSRNSSSLLCQKERACSHVPDLTAVVTHYLQSKNSWSLSSSSDGHIHPVKTMISRDISCDDSRCHRINLHDISQGTNHVTHFHQRKDRSSSSKSILMHWLFPSTLIWSKISCPEVSRTWS